MNGYIRLHIKKLINEGNHNFEALSNQYNLSPIDRQEVSELVAAEQSRLQEIKELQERLAPEKLEKIDNSKRYGGGLYEHQQYEIRRKYAERMARIKSNVDNQKGLRKYSMADLAREYQVSTTTIFNTIHMFNANDGLALESAIKHHKKLKEIKEQNRPNVIRPRGPIAKPDDPDAFWALVDKQGANDCWPWKGSSPTYNWRGDRDKARHMKPHKVAANIGIEGYPSVSLEKTTFHTRCFKYSNCCNPAHIGFYEPRNTIRKTNKLKWTEAKHILMQATQTDTTHEQILETYNITQNQLDFILRNPELVRKKTAPKRLLLEAVPYQPKIRRSKYS